MTNPSRYRAVLWVPNTVTILRIAGGVLLFTVIFYDQKITWARITCFIVIALTDWVDGWLARKINAQTLWGQLLDPLADKVVLLAAFGYFWFTVDISTWFTVLYFIRELLQTGIRIIFFTRNKTAQTPTLFISKLKTALSYLYGMLLFFEVSRLLPLYDLQPVHLLFEIVIITLSYIGFIKPIITGWNWPVGKK
jgi:CDP-diacylglycerol--glycerol-3-phosphate 3-phosphatidyltransferase